MISGRLVIGMAIGLLAGCSSDDSAPKTSSSGGHDSGTGGSASMTGGKPQGSGGNSSSGNGGAGASTSNGGSQAGTAAGGIPGAGGRYPDTFDPNDSPPKIGEPGCGFDPAAFCDTFGGPSKIRGRGGELDSIFWSAGRTYSQVSATRALGIGMAMIPECRPDLPDRVWPPNDALICHPTFDLGSGHLLAATAAQYYGQNGYRIRQPFDFTGRTGKIAFDASTDPLGPLLGFISVAITEDPISTPGYSITSNDEGSIFPKNAVEIHFANTDGDAKTLVRNIHVFKDYVDTLYPSADSSTAATRATGKVNHYEISISQTQIEVSISPYSDDGVTFAPAKSVHKQAVDLPITRGYVQISLHNHATLKYTDANAPGGLVDASVARIDNVGFDGPVITNWREYEVPDSLVKFEGTSFQPKDDPHNPELIGYDVAYILQDESKGPTQTLHFEGVDLTDVETAALAVTLSVDFTATGTKPEEYALLARLNGGDWLKRQLSAAEGALLSKGPTVLDPMGKKLDGPGSQGRYALMIDVPLEKLMSGDNTLEFVTSKIPLNYPPFVYNIDLILRTK